VLARRDVRRGCGTTEGFSMSGPIPIVELRPTS
jgi:hypothetical protein